MLFSSSSSPMLTLSLFLTISTVFLLLEIPLLLPLATSAKVPPKARQMLRPQPLEPDHPKSAISKSTPYFDPKTYASHEFIRLIEDFGQQLSRDFDKAHNELVVHEANVRELRNRVEQLERHLLKVEEEWSGAGVKFLILGTSTLSLALFLGLVVAMVLAKCCCAWPQCWMFGKHNETTGEEEEIL